MIDLGALVRGTPAAQGAPRYALVVAYQTNQARIAHGAIALAALPLAVRVRDDQACALPQDCAVWPRIALSCFRREGQAVPIVDTGRLFGTGHAWSRAAFGQQTPAFDGQGILDMTDAAWRLASNPSSARWIETSLSKGKWPSRPCNPAPREAKANHAS